LKISPLQVISPRFVAIAGLSMVFAPLNVAALLYVPWNRGALANGRIRRLPRE
jgi:MFS transporter, DHA2 family, multidrug resistance protein